MSLVRFVRVNRPDSSGKIRIQPSRVYILPTAFGMLFATLLVLLLVGSINYANNLGFLLTFFLASVGLVVMVHSWRNVAGLTFAAERTASVFAGEMASFGFRFDLDKSRPRPDIEVYRNSRLLQAGDLQPSKTSRLFFEITSNNRGYLQLGRCSVESRYPMGFFRAWSYFDSDARCLIYPKPDPWNLDLLMGQEANDESGLPRKDAGGSDFHGLRQYQPGDPLKSIHWQSLARGGALMSRDYESQTSNDIWLHLEDMPGPDLESRLRHLCHAALTASRHERRFGVGLGNDKIAPDIGDAHLAHVLRRLALFGKND